MVLAFAESPISWLQTALLVTGGLAWMTLSLKPSDRADDYRAAVAPLQAAITRYELDQDRPDSTLTDADEQASAILKSRRYARGGVLLWTRLFRRGVQ